MLSPQSSECYVINHIISFLNKTQIVVDYKFLYILSVSVSKIKTLDPTRMITNESSRVWWKASSLV